MKNKCLKHHKTKISFLRDIKNKISKFLDLKDLYLNFQNKNQDYNRKLIICKLFFKSQDVFNVKRQSSRKFINKITTNQNVKYGKDIKNYYRYKGSINSTTQTQIKSI